MHPTIKITAALLGGTLWLAAGALQAQTTPAAASAMPASPATSTPSATPAAAATASVSQAQFTTAVTNREPADDISTLDNSHTQVFFFTALKDAAGQTITHRWQYNGQTMAEVKFEPKANHWRVWSSKTLIPGQTGTWTVEVVDGSDKVLASKTLDYTAAAAATPEATHKVQAATKTTPPPAAVTHGDR
ncbi:MAG: DUF2914 domain-containing protein [Gammaproteobacteria bacterium]|nr:DUF2914 domain-containing protein [Gammaproteobacteria bacterium]MBU6509933.1 DUF2914 domain-containing protein [Gammaproteobacteria bacterium]MDE2461007.1 DUF2914 domain-containing protein [Gammaproteobacteria bacterium]